MRYIASYANDAAIQGAVDSNLLGHPYVALNESAGTIDWDSKGGEPDYLHMPLTIEALSGGTFYVRNANIGYSVNGADWETTTGETALSLNQGDTVRFRGTDGAYNLFSNNTLAFDAYGNIESLEYGDDFMNKVAIKNEHAYDSCFFGCTNLVSRGLILPATTLAQNCYSNMFDSCTSLTSAPELPATTLANWCYGLMFRGCTSLNYVKCLATNISAENCTYRWLKSVSPTGTFVKKAGVNWSTGNNGIPSGWTVQDA